MATILFYAPFNQRSRDTESLMIAFHGQGHRVLCLSQQEGFLIHDFLRSCGIETYSYALEGARTGWWYYMRHLIFFVKFCRKNKIEIVYSHLEPANFVASVAQYLIKAKVYLCRHHIDEGLLYKFDTDLYYRITYFLAKKIIVVSNHAKRYMIEREKIPQKKIIHIDLAYDFDLYKLPDDQSVTAIRSQFNTELLLLTACRLTAYKRPELAIRVVKRLTDEGLDVKLILLGKGELYDELNALIIQLGLSNNVFMTGYVDNVLEYMAAADFFLHPSILDSSCVAIKEAGLVELPVVVCRGVGDFDDYIVHETNGFVVDKNEFVDESAEIIRRIYRNRTYLDEIGNNLNKSVRGLFSIERVISKYDPLNAH